VGDIDLKVIFTTENSNKFQKTRFWKEKSLEDVVTLGPMAHATSNSIHKIWHTISAPSPHSPMNASNGPLGLNPLDTKIIQWIFPRARCVY
jgi:hypothetical protein